jgi:hypothetical protein
VCLTPSRKQSFKTNIYAYIYTYICIGMYKVKVKVTLEQATKAQRGSRGIAYPFFNLGVRRGVGGQSHAAAALSPGKTRYPSYRWVGRPQGRSGRERKISPPPGFDPRLYRTRHGLCLCHAGICIVDISLEDRKVTATEPTDEFSSVSFPVSALFRKVERAVSEKSCVCAVSFRDHNAVQTVAQWRRPV